MIKYIHGSADSIDTDVYYVFDELPNFQECQRFCSESKDENRNIIVIKDGIVVDCFKGTPDEINNGLLITYSLHPQNHELLITKTLERDVLLKAIRASRGILSYCSRTQYRQLVKKALTGNWGDRITCLNSIKFDELDFDNLGKSYNKFDILKTFAFQIGQARGLFQGVELYTKNDIAAHFPELETYLYRKDIALLKMFNSLQIFINELNKIEYEDISDTITSFSEYDKTMNIKNEKYIY